MKHTSTTLRLGAALATGALAVLLGVASPAVAHHNDDHTHGGGDVAADRGQSGEHGRDTSDGPTEDTDTNDNGTPNNVVDDGDNQHPSGDDKSVENGGSGNQGNSQSDPDGMENGGADKPGGPGGEDLADQDGNNGCGNDDDFEDDNNGNCGRQKLLGTDIVTPPTGTEVGGTVVETGTPPAEGSTVLGVAFERQADLEAASAVLNQPAEVLGVTFDKAPAATDGTRVLGVSLARTGLPILVLALLGLGLVVTGAGMKRFARR